MNEKGKIFAPVNGKCISLEDVPDSMFSDELMGKGIAFEYEGDMIYAPCSGIVCVVANTRHAIGIVSDEGIEILIHVGIDTVNLLGEGFEVFVRQGDRVKLGAPLIKFNRLIMQEKNINLITPMIITNHQNFELTIINPNTEVESIKTEVISFQLKENLEKEGKKMKYQKLCQDIIKNVGGKENVISVTHCVTRLRFQLKDETKTRTDVFNQMDGVMKIIQTGGQYQVVIGTHVDEVYQELIQIGGFISEAPVDIDEGDREENGILSRFLILMSGIFQPILSILMASGMIKAFLQLTILAGWMTADNSTYIILSAVGDALFYFFPIALGWSSAKKFGIKEIYGITIGACLTYPAIVALGSGEVLYTIFQGTVFQADIFAEFLGIPVILPMQTYASSVIPVILIVFVASLVYKFLNKKLPAMVRAFFVPFITLLVTVPFGLIVVGPIAMFVQNLLGQVVQMLININPGIAGLLVGSLWSVLVMFGLHMAIIPMFAINVAQYGYDIINPLLFPGSLAMMGAVVGVILRTKSIKEKNIAIPALISTFFGVSEPTLYGVLIPRKKVMITCFSSAGIGAAIAGFFGSKLYAFGSSSVLSLPCYLNPQGIDMGFIGLCIGSVVAFVLALGAVMVVGAKKDKDIDV